jgi:hypothetical protein
VVNTHEYSTEGVFLSAADVMTLVNAVFWDCLVQITHTDTLMVLIDPVFNKMSGLSTMSFPTCRDVEHTHCLKACSSLLKEARISLQEARSLSIVLGQHSANVSEGDTNIG